MQTRTHYNDNIIGAICSAFAFKTLAALITIYTVRGHIATEIAPVSAFLTSNLGVVSASILANLIWVSATICSLLLMQRFIPEGKIKQTTLKISMLIIVVVAAIDGLWDLGVVMDFNVIYTLSIIVFSLVFVIVYTLTRTQVVDCLS